jgi:DNA-binding transcriptional LysR family regulator
MDLNKLKTFYTLARVGNYSKCADKLCVTQSAVSHAVKNLEQSLDMELIHRKRSGFTLTGEGEVLFKTCQTVFAAIEEAEQVLLKGKNYPEVIRLGSPVEFGVSIVLKGIRKFYDKYPDVHIDFMLSNNLVKPLLDDELDMIIDCRPHAHPELKIIHLFREEYAVIATPAYIDQQGIQTPGDLKHCNILSLDKGLIWWSNFLNALSTEAPVVFNRVTEINHIRGIITAARASIGVGFVPKYTVLKDLTAGRLQMLFPGMDMLNDQINIYLKHRNASRDAYRALIDHIKSLELQ